MAEDGSQEIKRVRALEGEFGRSSNVVKDVPPPTTIPAPASTPPQPASGESVQIATPAPFTD